MATFSEFPRREVGELEMEMLEWIAEVERYKPDRLTALLLPLGKIVAELARKVEAMETALRDNTMFGRS